MKRKRKAFSNWQQKARKELKNPILKEIKYCSKSNNT